MDNHHPKGPHFHLDDNEFPYEFVGLDELVNDFRKIVTEHIGVTL